MPAPLVAASLAARLIARQLAEKSAKKIGTKAVKKIAMTPKEAALKKKAAVKVGPKNSVKVVKPSTLRDVKNKTSNVTSQLRKSGEAAKRSAADVRTGMPNATVTIKSGGNIKPAFPKKAKTMSYSQLKDMPNLVKIDSAKGNTVKKIAYRKRTSN
jgi:hypothetical protein